MKLAETFLNVAEDYASKVAVCDEDRAVTYEELRRLIDVRAHHIMMSTSSDKVGVLLPTGVEFVVTFFASLLASKTPVPINYYLSPEELKHIVKNAQLDGVVTCQALSKVLAPIRVSPLLVEHMSPSVSKVGPVEYPSGSQLATLLYTSGSEGVPKGVKLSATNLGANLAGCVDAIGFDAGFVVLGTLPLFHSFALTTTMLLPLLHGATAVYVGEFQPAKVLKAAEARKATAMMSIPSLYKAMLAHAGDAEIPDLSSLTHVISGGEPLPPAVGDAFAQRFGIEILNGYGLTETSPVVSVNRLGANRPGSVGRPLCNVNVQIMDTDSHRELGAGETGEICVEGLSVTEGYYHAPDLTRAAFLPGRYFKTGDIGRLDADGYLHVTGRRTDMMIIAGENVWPREIEDAIQSHPDVLECAVKGVPDETRGETPKAFVVPQRGKSFSKQDITDHCRRLLPRHKVPRHIEFLESLPKGPAGKVIRRALP